MDGPCASRMEKLDSCCTPNIWNNGVVVVVMYLNKGCAKLTYIYVVKLLLTM